MKIIIFGTGEYYRRYKIWFETEEVCALADNDVDKWGTFIDDRMVISPYKIIDYDYDAIFVLTFSIEEIYEQLRKMGIKDKYIFTFYDLYDQIYNPLKRKKVFSFVPNGMKKIDKDILLMNSDLVLGGPALALFNMAKILKKRGYSVTYASMVDGPLKHIILEAGIPVIVDANLLVETMNENEWVKEYSLIVCNTINYHVFISERDISIPIIWWLHDPIYFYNVANKRALHCICCDNLFVKSVGPIARAAIESFRSDFDVQNLLYGVEEVEFKYYFHEHNTKVKYVTIGFLEPHKGQDILINAIRELPEQVRKKSEFIFVGKNTSLYAKELMAYNSDIPEISFVGKLNRKEIHDLFNKIDVLICPSRQDCMPTVCAEAMMHYVPCIVSDATGMATYITEDCGKVFKSENVRALSESIIWFSENYSDIREMGINARKVYDKFFSMSSFEKSVISAIDEIYN